jgi:filamentous hemagglutinin
MKEHQFQQFASDLYAGLTGAGYGDAVATVQGSGATNQSHETGRSFDDGRVSDYDVALQSPLLVQRAIELGISLHGALSDEAAARLGLGDLRAQLSAAREREVNFLVVDPERSVNILDQAGIPVPRT